MKFSFFLIATLFLSLNAFADTERCYTLYMNVGKDDPGSACISFDSSTGEVTHVDLKMTDGHIKESFQLESTEHVVSYRGHVALHYYDIKGVGRYHRITASQSYGSHSLMSLIVTSLEDGHSQQAVEFSRRPVPDTGCHPGRRCI